MLQRFLVFTLFWTLFSNTINAQTWPMPGAKWKYCQFFWNGDTNGGYYEYSYTEDTLINGKTYQIIRLTGTKEQATITGYNEFSLYTRHSNDSVYRFVYNKDYLFFTWNVNLGDVQTTFRSNYDSWVDSACTAKLPLKVTNDYTVTYSAQNLRVILLKDTSYYSLYGGGTSGPDIDYRLVERIGVIDNRFFTAPEANGSAGICNSPMTDYGLISLSQYSDDTYQHVFFDCKPSAIEETQIEKNKFSIYPNPAKDFITLQNLESTPIKITIYDLLGQIVIEKETNANKTIIDLTNVNNGIYSVCTSALNKPEKISRTFICVNKN